MTDEEVAFGEWFKNEFDSYPFDVQDLAFRAFLAGRMSAFQGWPAAWALCGKDGLRLLFKSRRNAESRFKLEGGENNNFRIVALYSCGDT